MKLLKRYSSSVKLSTDGKEFTLSEKGWVTLRRADAESVVSLRAELEAPYKVLVEGGGRIPSEKMRKILIEAAARELVVDLRGQDWLPDNDPRIDPEDKLQLIKWAEDPKEAKLARISWLTNVLTDPDQEPLLDKFYQLAVDYQNFRADEIEVVRGN